MKSFTLFTEEIDDFDDAAAELKQQLAEHTLLKNTVGIIFTNADNDIPELLDALRDILPFPVIGTTALAMFADREGYCDAGISILVMTADDCEFHIGLAEQVSADNYVEKISAEYNRVSAEMAEPEKLIITYAAGIVGCVGDDIVRTFDSVSHGVPVYGAMASDGFTFSQLAVFDNTRTDGAGVVFILVSGNIRPLFACEYSISKENEFSAVVTRAEGNMVYDLDCGPFVDVMKEEGIESTNPDGDSFIDYIGSPFLVTLNMEDGNQIRVMRFLTTLNPQEKTGSFLGAVPEGSRLGIAILNRQDVEKSVHESLDQVVAKIAQEDGYEYSTFLLNSCAGRYLLLTRDHEAEARAYQSVLPENIRAAGFYTDGEFAPVPGGDGSRIYNVFHNSTFTVLAI